MTVLALSSFWMSGRDKRPLDFFIAGMKLGFDHFELSGIHRDTFYEEIRSGHFQIASLHDPAPPARGQAHIGSKELNRADILYTSLDEERRRQAIVLTKHSIDVAAHYGAQAVVLHIGQTSVVTNVERQLKNHQAPGKGNIDWNGLASFVPNDALRVIEIDNTVSVDALQMGVAHLRATGWIH